MQNSTYTGGVNNGLTFLLGIGTFTLGGLSDTGIADGGTTPISNAGENSLTLSDTAGNFITVQVGNNGASTHVLRRAGRHGRWRRSAAAC